MTSFTNTTRNYPTGADTAIRRVRQTRNPTTTDNHNFVLGDEWLNTSTQRWWKLCNITATTAKWVPFATNITGAIETITGDTGGAVPPLLATANVNLLGTAGQITVTGNPATNTLTISQPNGTPASSFAPDTGVNPVVPTAGGLLNVKGQSVPNVSGIRVTGALNELDIAMFSPFVGDFTFTSPTSGDTETLTVSNSSNTASSQAQIVASVAGSSAGDAWNQWTIGSVTSYSLGIDNSDSDILKLTYAAAATVTPSTGATLLQADSSGNIKVPTGDFEVLRSQTNGGPQLALSNDSAGANGSARFVIDSLSTTGDLYTLYDGPGGSAEAFEVGFQASTLSWIVQINPANVSPNMDGTTVVKVSNAGAVTMPLQPAFFGFLNATINNATGDATVATVVFNAETFDQASNFNTGTGVFTAPVTGKYKFTASVLLADLGAGHVDCVMNIVSAGSSAQTIKCSLANPAAVRNAANQYTLMGTGFLSLVAADTVQVTAQVSGSTKTVDFYGEVSTNYYTFFCGELVV